MSQRPISPDRLWLVLYLLLEYSICTAAFLLPSTAGNESPVEFSFEEDLTHDLYCSQPLGFDCQ